MTVGHAAIIQDLQKHVKDFRMGLFDLVKEHHRIRPAPDRLGQIATLLIAHVPGRRANQPGNRMLFHVFRHVNANHGLLVVKDKLCQGLSKFGFPHACRSHEDKGTDGPIGILQTGACPSHRIGDGHNRLVLAYNPF